MSRPTGGRVVLLLRPTAIGAHFQTVRFCHQESRNSTLLSSLFSDPNCLYLVTLREKIHRYLKHFCRSFQRFQRLFAERQPLSSPHVENPYALIPNSLVRVT